MNILYNPDLIKVILSDINSSNIESLTKLFSKSINHSENKQLEKTLQSLQISEFDDLIS